MVVWGISTYYNFLASFPGFVLSHHNKLELHSKLQFKMHASNFSFVASVYCVVIEFICENKKTGSLGMRIYTSLLEE